MCYERRKPGFCNEQGGRSVLSEWKTHMTGVTVAAEETEDRVNGS